MKNRYLILLILTLLAFMIYVWKYPPLESRYVKGGEDQVEKIITKDTIKPVKPTEAVCMDYLSVEPPMMQIDLINQMTRHYKNQTLRQVNRTGHFLNSGKSDARAIWFDFETLKRFLYYIEHYATDNNVSVDNLGIRAYYANYPVSNWNSYEPDLVDSDGNEVVSSKYAGMHTLILIPTIRRNNVDYDFNPKDHQSYGTSLNEIYRSYSMAKFIPSSFSQPPFRVLGLSNDRTTSRNHGSLFPPDPSNARGVSFPLR